MGPKFDPNAISIGKFFILLILLLKPIKMDIEILPSFLEFRTNDVDPEGLDL